MNDGELAAELAEEAGRLLLEMKQRGSAPDLGPVSKSMSAIAGPDAAPDGTAERPTYQALGRRGDLASNSYLLQRIATQRPGDRVLSEEAADDPARLTADRVWIIDPLDGTREFGIPGRVDWAVHVALWERGAGITVAAVAVPGLGLVHRSDQVRAGQRAGDLRILVSATRPPSFVAAVAQELSAEVVPMGSAGAKAMAVVRGEADAYVHAGGQWEWDSAAPAGVAAGAGLHVSRLDGSPMSYNRPDPRLPDLVICRPELAQRLLASIRRALPGPG